MLDLWWIECGTCGELSVGLVVNWVLDLCG